MGGYELGLEVAEAMGAKLVERLKADGRQVGACCSWGASLRRSASVWEGKSRLPLQWMGPSAAGAYSGD